MMIFTFEKESEKFSIPLLLVQPNDDLLQVQVHGQSSVDDDLDG